MRIFRRYLWREVTGAVLLILLAFLVLFGFFDMIGEIKDIGKGNYHFYHAIAYVLLRLPRWSYDLIPVAVLIGSLYALSNLARHSEITVLRASGLSTSHFLVTLLQIAGIFAIATFLVGELIAPAAEKAAQQLQMRAFNTAMSQEFRSGLWLKDNLTFVNVRTVLPGADLREIRIYEFDHNAALRSVSEAESGEYLGENTWKLNNIVRTVLDGNSAQTERIGEREWHSALTPDMLSVLQGRPESMSILSLSRYIRHLEENRQNTQHYEIALWKKICYPFATLVMVALALPFGYTHNRVAGVSLKLFVGVMIGVFFHMLNGLFSNLGVINSWPPFSSAIAPSLLFLMAAIVMLWWTERR
ncbi:MAG: LPS export ABC transporter permease LptG [Betaproteobacteria bacterium]|nr:LPS export ABC transporter permease LptG [Betaproteobacteria bacterium]